MRGRSVTELEILHGVLRDPAMADHAFFYFRDPAYVEGKPPDRYLEVPTADEIASFGAGEAARRAAERQAKLDRVEGADPRQRPARVARTIPIRRPWASWCWPT